MRKLINSLLPRMCVLCGLFAGRTGICDRCADALPWNDNFCCCCGQPIDAPDAVASPCGACIAKPPAFDIARAPLRYEFPIDVALKNLKFKARLAFVPPLADLLARETARSFPDCDVLVPIPLHRWRHAKRGFNQSDELCRFLAKATRLPVFMGTSRNRRTRSQSGLDAVAREKNVRRAFVVDVPFPFRFPLIVDDVMTTGATCNELAKALRRAGAKQVAALAVARAAAL